MGQQEIRFIPSTDKDNVITFKFSTDYNMTEITYEIHKFLTYHCCLNFKDISLRDLSLKGNWTSVPNIKYKPKLIQDSSIFDI